MSKTISLDPTNPALCHLSPRDRELFCAYGTGPVSSPSHPTMLAALKAAAGEHPHNLAVQQVLPDGSLTKGITYAELSRRSDALAALLRSLGVSNGDAVPLFIKRSVDMIIAIFAILKVGACYVPQDVRLAPQEQLTRIVSATEARVVLSMTQFADKLPEFPKSEVVYIDQALEHVGDLTFEKAEREVRPDDRCYVIFTSGTTGAPKGVQVTHGNVANVLLTDPMSLGMRAGLRVSQILSVAFDMGAWEILGCLSHGATLIIRDRKIADAVKHADIVISTPTVLGTIDSSQMHHVQAVAVAGEPCPRPLAEEWGRFCKFYNACGPTEVTIINTAKLFDADAEVLSIGKPTPNNTVYVLDAVTRKPCKIGEVGEMWGGGLCVSKGYLKNEKLTKGRYLPDPFVEVGRMYRTGDLGRWNEDGELEHFGRVDDQVKVKGFRVELDGVSACAEKAEGVQKAVVVKVDDYLVAFVTPSNVLEEQVKENVRERLPYYCVPEKVICLDELPKTGNGKVDKRKLVKVLTERTLSRRNAVVLERQKLVGAMVTAIA